MATSKVFGGLPTPTTVVPTPPKKLTPAQLEAFGNWIPGGDTKAIASDLAKRGLTNATNLFVDRPNTSTPQGVANAESDWKPAAIQQILMRARAAGITDPTTFLANKNYLSNGTFKDALNHPEFLKIHPNFWAIASGIYKDQLAKEK